MLDATAHILAAGEPLNTNRIAEVAGVSIGSLYQYFPSKESLVAALVERMLADDLAWMKTALEEGPVYSQLPRVIREVCARQASQAAVMAAVLPLLPVVERDTTARIVFDQLVEVLGERLRDEPGLRPELSKAERLDQAVFVVTRSLRWSLNEAAISHPHWLDDPGFHDELVALVSQLWVR